MVISNPFIQLARARIILEPPIDLTKAVAIIFPKVSVCLPVFNGEEYLAAAIESVLVQSFSNFELIIVDDCSTDQSRRIIENYARQDRRIVYRTSEQRAGLFENYNRCIEFACGEYIKLFAQDDLLHGDALEKLVHALDAHSDVALVSSARSMICDRGMRVTSESPQVSPLDYFPVPGSISGRALVRASIEPVVNFIGEPATVMYRRKFVGDGFDAKFYHLGDLEYWFRIVLNGRYLYIDEELCSFRLHSGSTTTANHKYLLYASDLLRIGRKYKRFIWEAGGTQTDFNDEVIKKIAKDVRARGDVFASSLLNVEPGFLCEFDEHTSRESLQSLPAGLLELALQALLRVPDESWQKVASRRAVIGELEQTLRTYLDSPSWRFTRLLREVNKSLIESDFDLSSEEDEDLSGFNYERYLRVQIRRVKRSRSWKITMPLRLASKWLELVLSSENQLLSHFKTSAMPTSSSTIGS